MSNILITKLNTKIKPETAFYFLSKKNYICFLDSSLSENKYSKFSYICFEPDFLIQNFNSLNKKEDFINNKTTTNPSHPLKFINDALNESFYFSFKKINKKPLCSFYDLSKDFYEEKTSVFNKKFPSFKGGFIGYLSYDLKKYIEALPDTVEDDLKLPLYNLAFFSKVFSYSHKDNCWYYIENLRDKSNPLLFSGAALIAKQADSFLASLAGNINDDEITKEIAQKYLKMKFKNIQLKSNISKENYLSSVLKAKKYIHNGDIYQVNFTHRFSAALCVDPADFYYILRKINSAPFCAFLDFKTFKIASTSPERFILINKNSIETRPIKGTRPRGENRSQDLLFKKQLKESIKDRAELNMIVDLERNDLGKFCRYNTIRVSQHAVIEKYAKVFHTVSTIIGKIKEGTNFSEIIKAVFPGGSITGAPKIRAMQIIDELEKNARSVYTGSIGYISIDGNVDFNIAIRTFLIKNNMFYYNTGGGIVEDSDCSEEYEETLQKGIALEKALKFFEYENLNKLIK